MGSYKVTLTTSAEKELNRLRRDVIPVIWGKLKELSQEPRPTGSKKLKGMEQSYRFKYKTYRVIYRIDDKSKRLQ